MRSVLLAIALVAGLILNAGNLTPEEVEAMVNAKTMTLSIDKSKGKYIITDDGDALADTTVGGKKALALRAASNPVIVKLLADAPKGLLIKKDGGNWHFYSDRRNAKVLAKRKTFAEDTDPTHHIYNGEVLYLYNSDGRSTAAFKIGDIDLYIDAEGAEIPDTLHADEKDTKSNTELPITLILCVLGVLAVAGGVVYVLKNKKGTSGSGSKSESEWGGFFDKTDTPDVQETTEKEKKKIKYKKEKHKKNDDKKDQEVDIQQNPGDGPMDLTKLGKIFGSPEKPVIPPVPEVWIDFTGSMSREYDSSAGRERVGTIVVTIPGMNKSKQLKKITDKYLMTVVVKTVVNGMRLKKTAYSTEGNSEYSLTGDTLEIPLYWEPSGTDNPEDRRVNEISYYINIECAYIDRESRNAVVDPDTNHPVRCELTLPGIVVYPPREYDDMPTVRFNLECNPKRVHGQTQGAERVGFIQVSRNPLSHDNFDLRSVTFDISSEVNGNTTAQPVYFIQGNEVDPAGTTMAIPVYWNPDLTQNPLVCDVDSIAYDLKVKLSYSDPNTRQMHSSEYKFPAVSVVPDDNLQLAEGRVIVPDLKKNEVVYNALVSGLIDVKYPFEIDRIQHGHHAVANQHILWRFKNLARVPNNSRSVILWDIKLNNIKFTYESDKERIVTREGKRLDEIFKLLHNSVPVPSENCYFISGGQCETFEIRIDPRDFRNIIINSKHRSSFVYLDIEVQFNMYTDNDGKEYTINRTHPDDPVNYRCTNRLRVALRVKPEREWLSIDFGTSAVVAMYGNNLVDLKDYKRRIIEKVYPDDEAYREIDEADCLINSNVCYNPANSGEVAFSDMDEINNSGNLRINVFGKLPLWFSPSNMALNKAWQLPCLKLLIGYPNLTMLFSERNLTNGVEYRVRRDNSLVTESLCSPNVYSDDVLGSVTELHPNTLIKTNKVFEVVYRQLLNYYIKQHTGNRICKLILSVPNTYTPLHVAMLRHIVRDALPTVYPEYLDVVSESDAVAYYYASNLDAFHKGLDANDPRRKCDNVLIYDMGAGTLDLTYFSAAPEGADGVRIEIKRKYGIVKAGNYLDYVLARIFVDLCRSEHIVTNANQFAELEKLLNTDDRSISIDDRSQLRNYVRNVVKPIIAKGAASANIPMMKTVDDAGDPVFSFNINLSANAHLTVAEFTEHPEFKAYLKAVTDEILDDFIIAGMKINTVIFSGRSSSIKQVREAVQRKVSGSGGNSVKFANLGNLSLVNKIEGLTNNANDPQSVNVLKYIVSEGAQAYSRISHIEGANYKIVTRDFYAKYGVLVINSAGTDARWYPLLDPDNFSAKQDVYRGERADIKLTVNDSRVCLIQTYSPDPAKDIRNNRKDTFTVLLDDNVDAVGNNNTATVSFTPRADVQLTFAMGGKHYELRTISHDFRSESLRRSLWPVVFDNSEKIVVD